MCEQDEPGDIVDQRSTEEAITPIIGPPIQHVNLCDLHSGRLWILQEADVEQCRSRLVG